VIRQWNDDHHIGDRRRCHERNLMAVIGSKSAALK